MSDAETAPAPAEATPAKVKTTKTPKSAQKKKKNKSAPANHPYYRDMIKAALVAIKDRGGSSRQVILKYIRDNYNVDPKEATCNQHLKLALRAGVKNGTLKQSKGHGACGSFKLGVEKTKSKKAKKSAEKKTTPAKPKKTAKKEKPKKVKKPKAAATPAKSTKKAKGKKSPKKAATKKPKKAAKKPKKAEVVIEVKEEVTE